MTEKESTHNLPDNHKVYTKTWYPTSPPRAYILFIHGFSDHSGNYDLLFTHLQSHGLQIHAFDQRGWGRSALSKPLRGRTGPTTTVLSDISSVLRSVLSESGSTPVFLMGHSMGGAEVLCYLSQDPVSLCGRLRGVLSLAPLIRLHPSTAPWSITVSAGKVAAKMFPNAQMVNKLDPKWLSHDEVMNAQWARDTLCHDTGTLGGLEGMLERGRLLDSGEWRVKEGMNEGGKTRVVAFHGTGDRINDYRGTERYINEYTLCEDKELKLYDGWYHNLHCENIGRGAEGFREDVLAWIEARLDISGGQTKL